MLGYVAIAATVPLAYWGYLKLSAKIAVDNVPREDMYECPRHGLFAKKDLMYLTSTTFEMTAVKGISERLFPMCPLCFHDKQVAAEKGLLGK